MNFTRLNIKNRTTLARCCYADMIIDMMEASASGDTELYNCMKKKAWILRYAITQMCGYESDNLFGANSEDAPLDNSYTTVSEITFPTNISNAPITLTNLRFDGSSGIDIATPGLVISDVVTKFSVALPKLSKDINSYNRANKYADGILDVKSSVDVTNPAAPILVTRVTYDRDRYGASTDATMYYLDDDSTSTTKALDSDTGSTAVYSEFTNETARAFLNQMDEYCGCPCGDHSKVTNDILPKYI